MIFMKRWTVFKREVDRCAQILEPHLGIDIRDIIYPKNSQLEERRITATEST